MFEEPNDRDGPDAEAPADPAQRAREKSDEFRTHAERAAVFEGARKFEAEIDARLSANVAREVQRTIGKLEKSKTPDSPILPDASEADAAGLLDFPKSHDLSTNDYHLHRRPGEVMIVRWLAGEQVATFYERLQAHFDAALNAFKEDQRQANEWKQDASFKKYLEALDTIDVKMAERYLRDPIRELKKHGHDVYILSTQSADEIDILHLCDYLMSVPAAEIVGEASAPPADDPSEADRAWFFKLFSLRGMVGEEERMCFFTYLQKSDETF